MLDVLLRRRRSAPDDSAAVVAKQGRTVTCFLRSSYDPARRRFRQGALVLNDDGVSWAKGMRGHGAVFTLSLPLSVRRVRDVGGPGMWNIKKGVFAIVEVDAPQGLIELAVPATSVQLVTRRLIEND